MAKLHVRYMVGGRVPGLGRRADLPFPVSGEAGRSSEVPEQHGDNWNITMFHYRNHGADYGRVLAGIQVPEIDRARFRQRLDELEYPCWEETNNPAYHLFLAS